MTAADEIRAAAERLRDRSYFEQTGEPDAENAVDTALADWLDHFAATRFDPEADVQVMDRSHELMLTLARLINHRERNSD